MAILEKNGALRGTAGSVVFRRFRGQTVVQGLPDRKKKQTVASQASACEFGLASTAAAAIRSALRPVFRNRHDGAMINRFNSAVYHSILGSKTAARGKRDLHDGDLSCLEGFEFNAGSLLGEVLKVKPVISLTAEGKIRVQMGGLHTSRDLKVPAKLRYTIDRYRLRFLATALNFRSEYYEYVAVKDLVVINGMALEAQDFEMEGTIPEGCMVIVSLSLECFANNRTDESLDLLNTVDFSPAAIAAAFQMAEALPMQQPKEVKKLAWNLHPCMDGYLGNELLEKFAGRSEKVVVRRKKRRPQPAGTPPENDRGRAARKSTEEKGSSGDASFAIGKRFSF